MPLRELALREQANELERYTDTLAGHNAVVPILTRRILQNEGFACEQVRKKAHVVRVIRDDEKVERARKLHFQPRRGSDLFAARELIGRVEPRRFPKAPASIDKLV
jgi:hypothetical protein